MLIMVQVCDIQVLVGKPKLFFIEACRSSLREIFSWLKSFFDFRGKENNFSMKLNSKVWI